jgi:hypothetical protein
MCLHGTVADVKGVRCRVWACIFFIPGARCRSLFLFRSFYRGFFIVSLAHVRAKSGEATACGEEFGEAMASRVSESDERRRSPTSGDKGKKDEGRARVQVDGRCAWMGSAARAMEEKMKSAAINRCN